MGARKMYLRSLMDEKPRLSYEKIAKATKRQLGGSFSHPTIARWMQDEPTEAQANVIEDAIRRIRKGE